MVDVIIEQGARIIAELCIALIGVLGAWLTAQLARRTKLATVNAAKDELILAAQQTVGELEQTMVKDMKAAALDGKLTEEEITALGISLYNITIRKLSDPAKHVLEAASVDIQTAITGAAEDWINTLRGNAAADAPRVEAIGFELGNEA